MEEPVVGQSIMFDAIVGGGGNDKGVFQMRCKAIWHCLESRKFWSVLNSLDGDLPNEVHFVKQCLNESEWTCCNGDCSYKKQYAVKCLIPTKSFQADAMITMHVHDHMVPVLQYEVTGEKPMAAKDVKKLSIMSCWHMCYTNSTYAVKIGKTSALFIYYKKNQETGTIDCNSYPVRFHGNRDDGGKFIEMLLVVLDHAFQKEGNIYRQVKHLIGLGKQKPGSDILLKMQHTTGSDCFLIPSMSYINDKKEDYSYIH